MIESHRKEMMLKQWNGFLQMQWNCTLALEMKQEITEDEDKEEYTKHTDG